MFLWILVAKYRCLEKSHGLSQEKLAVILNINRNYLSRIETGKSEPTLSIIRDVAKYFKVDVASLMYISDSNTNSKDKIRLITEGCGHLLDNDLNFILRLVSIMREEYVKRD